jgi:hypothetical protein
LDCEKKFFPGKGKGTQTGTKKRLGKMSIDIALEEFGGML